MLAQRSSKAGTGRNVIPNANHKLLQTFVLKAISYNVKTLHQRHTGLHHGGQLAGEHGNVERRNLLAAAEQRLGLFLDLVWNHPLLTQLGFHQGKVRAHDFALGFIAFAVFALPNVRFQRSEERRVGKECSSWWWTNY